jgi:hypothetical protein
VRSDEVKAGQAESDCRWLEFRPEGLCEFSLTGVYDAV